MSDDGNPPRDPHQPDPYGAQPGPYGQPPDGWQPYPAPVHDYASWFKRVGGTLIDALATLLAMLPLYVGLGILLSTARETTRPDGSTTVSVEGSAPASLLIIVGALLGIGFFIWNTFVRQGRTGATIGKSVIGIALIAEATGQPLGAAMAFVRYVVHQFTDGLCFLGYLWPLWDPKRQTWTDKILSQVVIDRPRA